MPQPTDLTIDGRSNIYVSSWMGASFRYSGEDVGFIARLRHAGADPGSVPNFSEISTDALVDLLASEHSLYRLHAQRELLRRSVGDDVLGQIAQVARTADSRAVRVASLFTLKQMEGADSHSLLTDLVDDPAVRPLALRALADRQTQNGLVSAAPFVEALEAEDPMVRLQALNGLHRLEARSAADDILPLVADPDRIVAHVAVQTLVELEAVDSALSAVRNGSSALVQGALKVLMRLHDEEAVTGLITQWEETEDPFTRRQVLAALARLYHKNVDDWTTDDWWGPTPSPRGPYYQPVEWAESDRIYSVLQSALMESEGYEYRRRVQLIERNRALPDGSGAVLRAASTDSLRMEAVETLLGSAHVTEEMISGLSRLSSHSGSLQRATTDLLTAQRALPAASRSLLGDAATTATLQVDVRADALRALERTPEEGRLADVTPIYVQLIDSTPNPTLIEETVQWYMGRSHHVAHVSTIAEMARAGSTTEKRLAYGVLLELADNELDSTAKQEVEEGLAEGWDTSDRTASLLWAIGFTESEEYADEVRTHLSDDRPSEVQSAAQYAAERLGL